MALKPTLTSLPSEIRQQIFKECLKVDGGYVYDVQTDKLTNADEAHTAINLSLRYTCRSIAEDTRSIPLTINTIHFSTIFRQDWCSLAGCFNLAAAIYYVLEQDFVFHLGEFITPEMFAEIESICPRFEALLKIELAEHQDWIYGNNNPEIIFDIDKVRPSLCSMVRQFLKKVDLIEVDGMHWTCPFRSIHNRADQANANFMGHKWRRARAEFREAISHCLRLIAEAKPDEFANYVYKSLPHWVGRYPAQDFIKLKFNLWDIPSREEVANMFALLDIAAFVWELPDVWHYSPLSFYDHAGKGISQGRIAPEFDKPDSMLEHFNIRCREKLRFSATAAAIRFLKRLPTSQGMQIRRLSLHEDLPSVNVPSRHVQGLVPLFKENPLLRVERRANVLGCVTSLCDSSSEVLSDFEEPRSRPHPQIVNWDFTTNICSWLLDALTVMDSNLPTHCFTFVLEAGSHSDYCTDLFQKTIHTDISNWKAWNICLQRGLLADLWANKRERNAARYAIDPRYERAIEHLLTQASILRCDFNPGVPMDVDARVEEAKVRPGEDISRRWVYNTGYFSVAIPHDIYHDVMVVPNFEIQTREEYIKAQGGKVKGEDL
ncbi:hypothetical protein IL306_008842 [Fusarium sp. DS 682]|nr:hypothetical protein IL306_008842 [Fusarium sp. DS 682]